MGKFNETEVREVGERKEKKGLQSFQTSGSSNLGYSIIFLE